MDFAVPSGRKRIRTRGGQFRFGGYPGGLKDDQSEAVVKPLQQSCLHRGGGGGITRGQEALAPVLVQKGKGGEWRKKEKGVFK